MRPAVAVVVIVAVMAFTVGITACLAGRQDPPPPPSPSAVPLEQLFPAQPVGRYVIVNGTPERAMNITLLDTTTGDSWLTCSVDGKVSWCPIERVPGHPVAPK